MRNIDYSKQMISYLESINLPQETIDKLVELIPNIIIKLEKRTDKLSPKKSMEKIKFN